MGHNKFIGKYEIDYYIKNHLTKEQTIEFNKRVENIQDTFSHYSLHCGGIVLYPDGVPNYLKHIEKSKNVINQITLSKYDIADIKLFKIDILSSRALTQLMTINKELAFKDFNDIEIDNNVMNVFKTGDNIGITLAESPLIRKAMIELKPNSIKDLAIVLSIIRPASKDAKNSNNCNNDNNFTDSIIFDDDAIDIISSELNIELDLADFYRRNYIKNNDEEIDKMYLLCKTSEQKNKLYEKIKNLHGYSFCKSHAFSYAELIYKLAFCKYYHKEKFWTSTLKHTETSYKKWVHYSEAYQVNVDFSEIIGNSGSVYRVNRTKDIYKLSNSEHFNKYGVWNLNEFNFYPGCYGYFKNNNYYFRGIIGQTKVINNTNIYFIGIAPKKYIEIIINTSKYFNKANYQKQIIQGFGKLNDVVGISVQAKNYQFIKI